MRVISVVLVAALMACGNFDMLRVGPVKIPVHEPTPPTMSFYDLSATDINGELVRMDRFEGKKVIVVNTASECGYTKQYKQLQELYEMYKDEGLEIVGFPSNDFGGQEPGTEADIAAFCEKNYGVTFPMMSKISIKGDEPHAIYHWLTNKDQNGEMDAVVKWNFHKFLIDEEGRLVKHLPSTVEPLDDQILDWVKQ